MSLSRAGARRRAIAHLSAAILFVLGSVGLLSSAAAAAPAAAPSARTAAQAAGDFSADFEGGSTAGWSPSGPGSAAAAVAISTAAAHDGQRSLAVTLSNVTSSMWGSTYVRPPSSIGPGSKVSAWVRAPSAGLKGGIAMQDANGAWSNGPSVSLPAGAWQQVTFTVPAGAVTPLSWIGVWFTLDGGTSWSGTPLVDSFSATAVVASTATPVPQSTATPVPPTPTPSTAYAYDFEDGTVQGWQPSGPNTGASSVANSQISAFSGGRSLAITLSGVTQANWGSTWIAPNSSTGPGAQLGMRVRAPAAGLNAAIALQDAKGTWFNQAPVALTAGSWQQLSYSVPSEAVAPLKWFGPWFTSTTPWSGVALMDAVTIRLPAVGQIGNPTATPASAPPTSSSGRTFYVSPSGSDANPGTVDRPWRSFYKAAATLQAGETAIFEDGVYEETQYRPYSAFANSGTEGAPITVKARNRHKAVLRFSNRPNETKIWIQDNAWITIQDFEITQAQRGVDYSDSLVRCWYRELGNGQYAGADHCRIIGNYIHNAVEPVKTAYAKDVVFDGNKIEGAQIAIGAVLGGPTVIIRNNEIVNPTETAIQTKGGTLGAQIYNNVVRTTAGHTTPVGMYVGGNGYESIKNVAYNNVVVSEVPGAIVSGIVLQGCHDCGVYNNIVVGAQVGIQSYQGNLGSQTSKGDDKYLYTVNPTILNNIVDGTTYGVIFDQAHTTGSIVIDHNLFNGASSYVPQQAHPVAGDPAFVNRLTDWRLGAGSAARGRGTTATFAGYDGATVDVSRDRDGVVRTTPWDLGIYRS